jgi:hypothetical protein
MMFCNAVGLLKSKIPNLKKNILTETEEGFQRHILLISLKIIIIKLLYFSFKIHFLAF